MRAVTVAAAQPAAHARQPAARVARRAAVTDVTKSTPNPGGATRQHDARGDRDAATGRSRRVSRARRGDFDDRSHLVIFDRGAQRRPRSPPHRPPVGVVVAFAGLRQLRRRHASRPACGRPGRRRIRKSVTARRSTGRTSLPLDNRSGLVAGQCCRSAQPLRSNTHAIAECRTARRSPRRRRDRSCSAQPLQPRYPPERRSRSMQAPAVNAARPISVARAGGHGAAVAVVARRRRRGGAPPDLYRPGEVVRLTAPGAASSIPRARRERRVRRRAARPPHGAGCAAARRRFAGRGAHGAHASAGARHRRVGQPPARVGRRRGSRAASSRTPVVTAIAPNRIRLASPPVSSPGRSSNSLDARRHRAHHGQGAWRSSARPAEVTLDATALLDAPQIGSDQRSRRGRVHRAIARVPPDGPAARAARPERTRQRRRQCSIARTSATCRWTRGTAATCETVIGAIGGPPAAVGPPARRRELVRARARPRARPTAIRLGPGGAAPTVLTRRPPRAGAPSRSRAATTRWRR